jgi:hypothetical protein
MPELHPQTYIKLTTAFVTAENLSATARAIYTRLRCYQNRHTGQCNPRVARLAADLGVSESTIKRGLRNLRLDGWIISNRSIRGCSYRISDSKGPSNVSDGVKFDPMHQVKFDPMHGVKNDPMGTAVSLLTEPELIELGESAAADGVYTSCEGAAAAALLPLCEETHKPKKPPAEPVLTLAQAVALELLKVHPQPGNSRRAAPEIERILRAAPDPEVMAARIRDNHKAWMDYWAALPAGRFIPQLWRWIHDGDWEQKPASRRPVQSETWHERHERERKESDEDSFRRYAELGMWSALREYGGDELVEVWREKIKTAV